MTAPLYSVDLNKLRCATLPPNLLIDFDTLYPINHQFQPGGPVAANQYLSSFYMTESRVTANTSLNQKKAAEVVVGFHPIWRGAISAWNKFTKQLWKPSLKRVTKRNLGFFINRLHWHCHFMQKFESECRMEFENLNKGFDEIRNQTNHELVTAWETGATGYPLIDACVNCVK